MLHVTGDGGGSGLSLADLHRLIIPLIFPTSRSMRSTGLMLPSITLLLTYVLFSYVVHGLSGMLCIE